VAAEPDLGLLPVEVGDRLLHLAHGALPDTAALVQHPVDGGRTEPGLSGDLTDAVRVLHAYTMMVF